MFDFIKTRDVKSPERANDTDSGIDFFIPNDLKEINITPTETSKTLICKIEEHGFEISPGYGLLIPSGIKMVIPKGYDLVFDNKSGVSVKYGLIIGAKVVDSSYRGEVHLHLINTSNRPVFVKPGQKIVQGIVRRVELLKPFEVSNKDFEQYCNTERGEGGFGSTGEK